MAVVSPVLHVLALAEENVAERRVSAVAGTGKHHVLAVDLPWKQHCVPVKRQERIFHPDKCLKVGSLCHADGCAVGILAPDHIISAVHFHQPWVVGINRLERFSVFIQELNLFLVECPVNAVCTSAEVNKRNAVHLLSPEHADKSTFIRNDCAVENACHTRDGIPGDNGIFLVAPYRCSTVCRALLPRQIGQAACLCQNRFHCELPPYHSLTAPIAMPL